MADFDNRMKELESLINRNDALKQQEDIAQKRLKTGQVVGNILGGSMSNVQGPNIKQGIEEAWTKPQQMDLQNVQGKRKDVLNRYESLRKTQSELEKQDIEKRKLDLLEQKMDADAELAKKRYLLDQNKLLIDKDKNKYANLSPAQKSFDAAFGKELYGLQVEGKLADAEKGIQQIRKVSDALASNKNLTGPLTGIIGETGRKYLAPESYDIEETLADVIQRSMRPILGSQFTENEGKRLIARAYNPALPTEYNKERVDRLLRQMEMAYQAKVDAMDYYKENNTMAGYKGKIYTKNDFLEDRIKLPNEKRPENKPKTFVDKTIEAITPTSLQAAEVGTNQEPDINSLSDEELDAELTKALLGGK